MSEPKPGISSRILSMLQGECLRVTLNDGTVVDGVVTQVNDKEVRLGDQAVPIAQITNCFTLKSR